MEPVGVVLAKKGESKGSSKLESVRCMQGMGIWRTWHVQETAGNCLVGRRVVRSCGVGRDDLRYSRQRRGHLPDKELDCVLKVMMDLQFGKITSVFWEMDAGVEIK